MILDHSYKIYTFGKRKESCQLQYKNITIINKLKYLITYLSLPVAESNSAGPAGRPSVGMAGLPVSDELSTAGSKWTDLKDGGGGRTGPGTSCPAPSPVPWLLLLGSPGPAAPIIDFGLAEDWLWSSLLSLFNLLARVFRGRVEKCHFSGFDLIFSFRNEVLLFSQSLPLWLFDLETLCNVENWWELQDTLSVPCRLKLFPSRTSGDFASFAPDRSGGCCTVRQTRSVSAAPTLSTAVAAVNCLITNQKSENTEPSDWNVWNFGIGKKYLNWIKLNL